MRITEDIREIWGDYSVALENRVEEVWRFTLKITEIKNMLAEIKQEALNLQELSWTKAELEQREDAVNFFAARMQAMVYYTLKNIEKYQQSGWEYLVESEGDCDE
ncbi:MAG: hypothetical protein ACOWWO_11380 [Peptococcaceae bacterium]